MTRAFACIGSVALLSGMAFGQAAPAQTVGVAPAFDIADVHVSPRSTWTKTAGNSTQGGVLNAGRYELRRATLLDLIKIAYTVDADKVSGGPSWLDYDRFDVIAKTQPAARPETVKLMLQSLLADRFKLVVKADTRPMPAYVLSMGPGKPKLKATDGSSGAGCQSRLTANDVPYVNIQCRNMSMEAFAPALRRLAASSFNNLPVVDSTGLEGAWDFDLQYPLLGVSLNSGASASTSGNLFEAVDKQLGLKLELQKAPQPVLAVESANDQPSANPPGVATSLPPSPARV
jgi:uncharacterized protein (TIGR03435 family)